MVGVVDQAVDQLVTVYVRGACHAVACQVFVYDYAAVIGNRRIIGIYGKLFLGGKDSTCKVGPRKIRVRKISIRQDGLLKIGAFKINIGKIDPPEIRFPEFSHGQVGILQLCVLQVSLIEDGLVKCSTIDVRLS